MGTLALISLLASLAGTGMQLYGSHKANKAQKEIYDEQQNALFRDKANLSEWKAKNSTNYLDSQEGQSAMSQIKDNALEANDIIASNSAVTGASNAMQAAQKKNSQASITDAIRGLAQYGTQYRQNTDSQFFNQNNALTGRQDVMNQNKIGIEANKNQQWANFINNLGNAGTNAYMSSMMNGGGDWDAYGNRNNLVYKWT